MWASHFKVELIRKTLARSSHHIPYDHSSLVACRFRHVRFKFKYPSIYTYDLINDDLCHLVLVSSFGVNLGSCF